MSVAPVADTGRHPCVPRPHPRGVRTPLGLAIMCPPVQRRLEEALRLGTAHACAELVRVSLNALHRCQRDGIDPDLDSYLSCSRKHCDSLAKVSREAVKFGGHGLDKCSRSARRCARRSPRRSSDVHARPAPRDGRRSPPQPPVSCPRAELLPLPGRTRRRPWPVPWSATSHPARGGAAGLTDLGPGHSEPFGGTVGKNLMMHAGSFVPKLQDRNFPNQPSSAGCDRHSLP
jgi:hypothetical protein